MFPLSNVLQTICAIDPHYQVWFDASSSRYQLTVDRSPLPYSIKTVTVDGIPPSLFLLCQLHQCADRSTFISVSVNTLTAMGSNPAPHSDQAHAPEKVMLHLQPVEPPHVLFRIDPA